MLIKTGYIIVGKYRFNRFKSVDIESSWENFTDTATVVVPRRVAYEGATIQEAEKFFKVGDKIEIWLGFDHNNEQLFTGYIAKIKPQQGQITFHCDDEMWQLKKGSISKSYASVSLKQLLTDIVPFPVEAENLQLGKFRINGATAADVLKALREGYGIYSWFRAGKLYAGFAYKISLSKRHVFRFGHNIVEADDLFFTEKDAVPLKVRAISINSKNEKIEINVPENPDADAEQRTFYKYNVDKATLKKCAEEFIQKNRWTGFQGGFVSFGQPACRHGDIAVIQDPQHKDRDGTYLIRKVTISSNNEGYFQTISLHQRIT